MDIETKESNVCIKVGDSFSSFSQLRQKIEKLEKETFSSFKVRNCLTKSRGEKLSKQRVLKDGIEYYSIKYVCKHGGRSNQKSKSTGQRETKTFQLGCGANFTVVASDDGNSLFIKTMDLVHNHTTSKALYECLPENRKLIGKEMELAQQELTLGANKKKVKHQMQILTGKKVISKDLSNLVPRMKEGNNLMKTITMLRDDYGAECEVLTRDSNTFEGIVFITADMKQAMAAYPEFIGVDATYKLLNLRAPLYLVVIEDSQGQTQIVSGCILIHETQENMKWFIDTFKKHHPSWEKIKTIMADKDISEREIFKQNFPNAKINICVFHTERTFNREITTEKLSITKGQKDTAKSIIQKMIYSKDEEEYFFLYDRLRAETPMSVQNYFNKNWHNIRDEWILSSNFMKMSFKNTTNNRLESLNAKIKSVAATFATLEQFIVDFFILISTRNDEHDVIAAYSYLKKKTEPFNEDSPEYFYCNFLTNYAFHFVRKELEDVRFYKITGLCCDTGNLIVQRDGSNRPRTVSPTTCNCNEHLSMGLPCRHIFAAREYLNISLSDGSLCLQRWTQKYYMENQRVFQESNYDQAEPALTVAAQKCNTKKPTILTHGRKLKIAREKLLEMTTLLADFSTPNFLDYIEFFDEVKRQILRKEPLHLASVRGTENESVSEEYGTTVLENALHSENNPFPKVAPLCENASTSENALSPESTLLTQIPSLTENALASENASFSENKLLTQIPSLTENALPSENALIFKEDVLLDIDCDVLNLSSLDENLKQNCNILSIETKELQGIHLKSIENIKMPPVQKMRGRPKHSTTTTPMGLPKTKPTQKQVVPFEKKSVQLKILQILKWFVNESIAAKAILGREIVEAEVEVMPQKVCSAILEEEVNLLLVKSFFSEDAWLLVSNVYNLKKKENVLHCGKCNIDIEEEPNISTKIKSEVNNSVRCDCCLQWFHFVCLNLKKIPRTKYYFCKHCKNL